MIIGHFINLIIQGINNSFTFFMTMRGTNPSHFHSALILDTESVAADAEIGFPSPSLYEVY